jgi:hypothetical protein
MLTLTRNVTTQVRTASSINILLGCVAPLFPMGVWLRRVGGPVEQRDCRER